jgi:hypothetical protein
MNLRLPIYIYIYIYIYTLKSLKHEVFNAIQGQQHSPPSSSPGRGGSGRDVRWIKPLRLWLMNMYYTTNIIDCVTGSTRDPTTIDRLKHDANVRKTSNMCCSQKFAGLVFWSIVTKHDYWWKWRAPAGMVMNMTNKQSAKKGWPIALDLGQIVSHRRKSTV